MIYICSQQHEPSTHEVMDWIYYLGADVTKINSEDLAKELTITIDNEQTLMQIAENPLHFNGQNSFWFRKWDLRALLDSYEHKENKTAINKEIFSISSYLLHSLQQSPHINQYDDIDNKLIELNMAKEVGLLIPATIVCTKKDRLLAFYEQYQSIITKPLSAHLSKVKNGKIFITYTTLLTQQDIEALPEVFFPSLFQQNIEKEYEIRVFFLEKKIYAMAIFSQADSQTQTDFRQYNMDKPNRTVPFKLPVHIEQKVQLFTQKAEINSGSIDLIKSMDGNYYFLENNPVGQFGMVSSPCNYFLEKQIAENLIDKQKKMNNE